MPIGGSGVTAEAIKGSGGFLELVKLLGDPEGYKQRFDELTAAIAKLETDKGDAIKAVTNANSRAKQILAEAEASAAFVRESANDEAATVKVGIAASRAAFAKEKDEWDGEVRRLRGSLGASTRAANAAKDAATATKTDLDGEITQTHEVRQKFLAAMAETRGVWERVKV